MEHRTQENLAGFAMAREAPRSSSTSAAYAGARPTILIVDDFDDTRLLMRTWLERRGFRVIEAENGCEAVSEAQCESPDLIIMDLEMPELDGLEATRAIRQIQGLANIPILAVSAYGAEQYRAPALHAGCNEYVSTPFEPAQLESLIRSYMP